MVSYPVECLDAEVQWRQRDIGTPHRMVVSAVDVWRQRVLTGVTARTVAAVMTERDRFRQRDIQAERACHRRRYLGDLERMRETGALMVVREHEDLRLARQSTEGARMEDSVAVTFEARTPWVRRFFVASLAGTDRVCCGGREREALHVFAVLARRE